MVRRTSVTTVTKAPAAGWSRPTRQLLIALKLHSIPAYKLALRSGIDPSLLSKWLHGERRLAPRDPRLARLARVLGLRLEEAVEEGSPDGN
jgi:transcriptional regulator with XRE-family HTH domain